ncbi:MAG: hypothetical protein ACRDI3_08825 [Actinomycetota bacterium]
MTGFDRFVTESLQAAVPRAGFEAELGALIADASRRPFLIDRDQSSPRWPWIVVGVAGVASASGAALWSVRRRQRHKGVA